MNYLVNKLYQIFYTLAYRLLLCIWFIFRPNIRGVNVAIWYRNKVLIIKPSYKNEYAMPGGYIKRGEDKRKAASREVWEELKLKVSEEQLEYVDTYLNTHEYKRDYTAIFEVRFPFKPPINIDHREVKWANFLSLDETTKLKLPPSIKSYFQKRIEKAL